MAEVDCLCNSCFCCINCVNNSLCFCRKFVCNFESCSIRLCCTEFCTVKVPDYIYFFIFLNYRYRNLVSCCIFNCINLFKQSFVKFNSLVCMHCIYKKFKFCCCISCCCHRAELCTNCVSVCCCVVWHIVYCCCTHNCWSTICLYRTICISIEILRDADFVIFACNFKVSFVADKVVFKDFFCVVAYNSITKTVTNFDSNLIVFESKTINVNCRAVCFICRKDSYITVVDIVKSYTVCRG